MEVNLFWERWEPWQCVTIHHGTGSQPSCHASALLNTQPIDKPNRLLSVPHRRGHVESRRLAASGRRLEPMKHDATAERLRPADILKCHTWPSWGLLLKKTDGCRAKLQSDHKGGKDGLIWTHKSNQTQNMQRILSALVRLSRGLSWS